MEELEKRPRDDQKEDWTGNEIRAELIAAGIPNPNRVLIDTLAPVLQESIDGGTLRRWKHLTSEMAPMLKEMRPLFQRINEFKESDDKDLLAALLKEASDLFYKKLTEFEVRKARSTTSDLE